MRNEPRLFQLLVQAHRSVVAAAERETRAELGISPAQLALLYALEAEQPLAMAAAGQVLDLSAAAVSGLADRCERLGLIRRQPSARDARSIELVATARGEALRAQSYPLLAALNAALVEGLDAGERVAAAKFLTGLVDRFGNAKGD